MPQVDFTLEDVRQLIEQSELRITRAVSASFGEYEQKYDARFDRVDQRLDKVDQRLDKVDQRLDKVEHRLGKVEDRLTGVETEVKSTRRLVGLHSEEIMELKARPA